MTGATRRQQHATHATKFVGWLFVQYWQWWTQECACLCAAMSAAPQKHCVHARARVAWCAAVVTIIISIINTMWCVCAIRCGRIVHGVCGIWCGRTVHALVLSRAALVSAAEGASLTAVASFWLQVVQAASGVHARISVCQGLSAAHTCSSIASLGQQHLTVRGGSAVL